jgi:hypothetical protein
MALSLALSATTAFHAPLAPQSQIQASMMDRAGLKDYAKKLNPVVRRHDRVFELLFASSATKQMCCIPVCFESAL